MIHDVGKRCIHKDISKDEQTLDGWRERCCLKKIDSHCSIDHNSMPVFPVIESWGRHGVWCHQVWILSTNKSNINVNGRLWFCHGRPWLQFPHVYIHQSWRAACSTTTNTSTNTGGDKKRETTPNPNFNRSYQNSRTLVEFYKDALSIALDTILASLFNIDGAVDTFAVIVRTLYRACSQTIRTGVGVWQMLFHEQQVPFDAQWCSYGPDFFWRSHECMVVEHVRSVCSVVWFKIFSIYPEPEDLSLPIAYYYLPPYIWPPRIPSYALILIYYRISIPRFPPYASSLSTESPVYKSVRTGDRREIGDNEIKGNRLSRGVFWGKLKIVWVGWMFRGGVSCRLGP